MVALDTILEPAMSPAAVIAPIRLAATARRNGGYAAKTHLPMVLMAEADRSLYVIRGDREGGMS